MTQDVERIPASDILHLFVPDRAEQVRGISWFHAVILRGSMIHKFEEAAVVAAQVGASKIAALERAEEAPDAAAMMADGTAGGLHQMKVEAGELFELPPGYKLSSWNPEYPHANFESFLKTCLRGLAAGLDVAAHNLTGDMTDVNYSSARIAELSEREMWMILQDWLIGTFATPIYEEWLALSLLAGSITFDSGSALPADKLEKFTRAARFQGRRWSWVDPLKEVEADASMLSSLLTSRTRLAAERGEEFDDILEELALESEAIKSAGLPVVPPPVKPMSTAPSGASSGA
jgi:lambda family phage portal protein